MTREEKTAKLAELRAKAEELAQGYNEAYQDKKFDVASQIDADMVEVINEYTAMARDICFNECKDAEDPMRHAVLLLTFRTIRKKDDKATDDGFPVRSIDEKDIPIDLAKLHKFCGGIGADKNWIHYAYKMNFSMTIERAKALKIKGDRIMKINDSFTMSEFAKQMSIGGANPCSNTQLLKTLRGAISAMIGPEYANKIKSPDVRYIQEVYAKMGKKALTVYCSSNKEFIRILANLCNKAVVGALFDIESKEVKDK